MTEKLRQFEKAAIATPRQALHQSEITAASRIVLHQLVCSRGWGTMRKSLLCASALVLALIAAPGGTAQAQSTGLDALHDKVRVGGKLCMADHFHDGSGSGSTRAAAQRAAIGAWVDFTAWEYGSRWGSFNAALSKRISCSGGPGNYNCSVSARPCRY